MLRCVLQGSTALVLAFLLVACDSSSDTDAPSFPDGPLPTVYTDGRTWTYDYTLERDAPGTEYDTTITATLRLRVRQTDAAVGGRTGLVMVEMLNLSSSPVDTSRLCYAQAADSLIEVAYQSPQTPVASFARPDRPLRASPDGAFAEGVWSGTPSLSGWRSRLLQRRIAQAAPQAAPQSDERAANDPVTVRDDPRVALVAPLEEGASWVSFVEPFPQIRTVGAQQQVTTEAGRFETVVVDATLPEDSPRFRLTDFVAPEGLVRRVVADTAEARNPDGSIAGEAVFRETFDLVAFEDPS
jgi:hypothetical protein